MGRGDRTEQRRGHEKVRLNPHIKNHLRTVGRFTMSKDRCAQVKRPKQANYFEFHFNVNKNKPCMCIQISLANDSQGVSHPHEYLVVLMFI